ncbi:MAG: hypothetical protein ACOYN0_09350 [Phycisphaerales bacterium]
MTDPTPTDLPTPERVSDALGPDAVPEPSPKPQSASVGGDRWAHRRAEPRGLAFLWTCYLLAATAISIGQLGRMGLTTYEVYRPAARVLLTFVLMGVAVLWPMVRLSQEAPGRPMRSFLADAVVMLAPGAAIIFSQSFPGMAGWSLHVVATVAGFALAWGLVVCGLLGMAMTSSLPRWCWMIAVVGVALAGPAASVVGGVGESEDGVNPFLVMSPLTVSFEVTRDRLWSGATAQVTPAHLTGLFAVTFMGAVVFVTGAIRSSRVVKGTPPA